VAAGVVWRAVGRVHWGGSPFLFAFVVATLLARRSDWPHWDAMAAVGVLVTLLACVGSGLLLTDEHIRWEWVAAGALTSASAVWAGVPETAPAVLAAGCLTGVAVYAAFTGSSLSPAAGAGMAAVIGWAALSGASGRPWAEVGGALCTGVAPWLAVRTLLPVSGLGLRPGPWLLCAHAGLAALAARWIGVVPHAGWGRVAAMAAFGLAMTAIARREAA
jgi:hypothetical protein